MYMTHGDDVIFALEDSVCNESYHVCEYCGSTHDVKQTSGWVITLCQGCRILEQREEVHGESEKEETAEEKETTDQK